MEIKLSDVLSILALFVSICNIVYGIRYRKKTEKIGRTPKIKMLKVQFMKNEHVRYYDKNDKRDLSYGVGNTLPLVLEDDFIDELRCKKGEIYFTDMNGQRSLMLNFLNDASSLIVEHNITRVTFYNDCKIMLKSMAVLSAKIQYMNGAVVTLRGNEELVSFPVLGGNNFHIYIDEATNDFQYSICELNSNVYKKLESGVDVLDIRFDKYFLKYKSIIFNVRVCNGDDEKFDLIISLKKNDKYLEPSTKIKKR